MYIVYEPKTNQELSVIMLWFINQNYHNTNILLPMIYDICVDVPNREYSYMSSLYKGPAQFIRPRNLSGMINQIKANE